MKKYNTHGEDKMKSGLRKTKIRKENMMQGRRGILTITTDTGEVYYQYITKKEAKARRCGGFETLNIPDREIYNSSSIDVKDTLKVERPKLIKSVKMRYNDGITRIDTEGIIEGKVYLG